MALPVSVIYNVRDSKGATATTEIYIPSSTSPADWIAFAKAMALLIDDLTRGVIYRVGVCLAVDLSALGLDATPIIDSDVEEGGFFNFASADRKKTLTIPAFDEDMIFSNSNRIDQSDAAVAAFITAMTAGLDTTSQGGSGVISPVDYSDGDLLAITVARENFGKTRS